MNKYIGIVLLSALAACGTTTQDKSEELDSISTVASLPNIKLNFNEASVQSIFDSYIVLKDALVNAKDEEARAAAKMLSTHLNAHQGCENTALIADRISSAKNLTAQRKEFTLLSADVIAMYKHADLKEGTIYVQHCPMANNGDGGDWLSANKEVRNPYYGDEMLECGAVIEEIK